MWVPDKSYIKTLSTWQLKRAISDVRELISQTESVKELLTYFYGIDLLNEELNNKVMKQDKDKLEIEKLINGLLAKYPGHTVAVVMLEPSGKDCLIASSTGDLPTIILLERAYKKLSELQMGK